MRAGAHLSGFDDSDWQSADTLTVSAAGMNFFRTTFDLVGELSETLGFKFLIVS